MHRPAGKILHPVSHEQGSILRLAGAGCRTKCQHYTSLQLLDPLFYQVFQEYNRSVKPAKRLWLLQEIWKKLEGYAGGIIFELMDEWTKKTWITVPYMVPFERNAYWHNALCPEQNYGLLAMESAKVPFFETGPFYLQDSSPENTTANAGLSGKEQKVVELRRLWVDHNETFLYLGLELFTGGIAGTAGGKAISGSFLPPGTGLLIGLDTIGPERGTRRLPLEKEYSPHGLEYVMLFRFIKRSATLFPGGIFPLEACTT